MKTPDEIKKGLECCKVGISWAATCARGCPYLNEPVPGVRCEMALLKDALALIQQLERERDAMLDSMKQDPHCCFHCNGIGCITRKARGDGSCFEWRGLEEDENERES